MSWFHIGNIDAFLRLTTSCVRRRFFGGGGPTYQIMNISEYRSLLHKRAMHDIFIAIFSYRNIETISNTVSTVYRRSSLRVLGIVHINILNRSRFPGNGRREKTNRQKKNRVGCVSRFLKGVNAGITSSATGAQSLVQF